jgi:hypothetical protein
LKSDQVALSLEQTVDYVQTHQQPIVRAVIAVVALAVVIGGFVFYRGQQKVVRDTRLAEAQQVSAAPVGALGTPDSVAFPTNDAKAAEESKVFTKLAADYPGSTQGYIAEYYLGGVLVSQAKLEEARKKYQEVADHASKDIASLAKFALAQIDLLENRTADAQRILQELMDNPTSLVSRDQAAYTLADGIKKTNPAEARKLLDPLVKENGAVAGDASRILNELPK